MVRNEAGRTELVLSVERVSEREMANIENVKRYDKGSIYTYIMYLWKKTPKCLSICFRPYHLQDMRSKASVKYHQKIGVSVVQGHILACVVVVIPLGLKHVR